METDLFKDRVFDTADICEKTNKPKFFGFLSSEHAALADRLLEHRNVDYRFFGGYEEAQRVMLGCFPDWSQVREYPIIPITAQFRKADKLSHRDVLGSIMALGLKREAVGDILIEDGRTVMFLTRETADYVLSQITKIGRVGVNLKTGFEEPLPSSGELRDFSVTVASERLDCVVSALIGVSRGKAAEIIENSFVTINSVVTEKVTARVTKGDILSVRKKGKFIIESLEEKTRKDRIVLKYKKYM